MFGRLRRPYRNWKARRNHDLASFVYPMDLLCAADGRPSMAIDPLCCPGRDPRIRLAEESGPRTLLGLADGVREVPDSVFAADSSRQPSRKTPGEHARASRCLLRG